MAGLTGVGDHVNKKSYFTFNYASLLELVPFYENFRLAYVNYNSEERTLERLKRTDIKKRVELLQRVKELI